MRSATLTIDKKKVYGEVARTTSYVGAKKTDDETAYDRIFTTDEDQEMLERFWDECRTTAVDHLKRFLSYEDTDGDGEWTVSLRLPDQFDVRLEGSMERSLFSYMVMGICAKWYSFTDRDSVVGYAEEAAASMEDVLRMAHHRQRPRRPNHE